MTTPSNLDLAATTGLEQLRLMLAGGLPPPPIAATAGFTLDEVEEGRVVFSGTPTRAFYNPLGTVHGGWISMILDSACGCAVHTSIRPGQTYTTLELKTAFHRPLREGTPVVSVGRLIHPGRRAAYSEADLRGLDGRLYATATSSCLIMDL
jgi:uncharacterized protein (TIGR00369 family)